MIRCPFCHYDNEDGALFCERCTSDLAVTAAAAPPAPPIVPAIPIAEPLPMGSQPMIAEAIPLASAEGIEAIPMAPLANLPSIELTPLAPIVPMALDPTPIAPAMAIPAVEPVAPTPPPPSPPTPVPVATPAPAVGPAGAIPGNAQPRLLVMRGQKRNVEYPIYEGLNFIGRADEKPVDIDLEEQEPPDRIWCSRQHACISFEDNQLTIEDLNSANGTYVNRSRVYPGSKLPLKVNDVVQIGNVQLKVLV